MSDLCEYRCIVRLLTLSIIIHINYQVGDDGWKSESILVGVDVSL
jgi:hypothetical protein